MQNLVGIVNGRAITTSLVIAEKFHKRHDNVLQKIKDLECSDGFRLLNFKECFRINVLANGKKEPYFEIKRDGFSFLVMGFTGKDAAHWKEKYISAFNQMENALLQKGSFQWQQSRLDSKVARRVETDKIREFISYAAAQGSKNAEKYFINITNMTYRALFLVKQASPKPFRDMLDAMQLSFLTTAEYVAQKAIEDGIAQQMFYKDIYQLARERVESFAHTVPQTKMIAH